jgi:hypothetical protein
MTIDLTVGRASLRESVTPRRRELAFESTLLDVFDATVVAWGERPALEAPDTALDYNQLAGAADAVAGRLRESIDADDQLAGPMLITLALGTPLMSLYLRAMGATIGRDVWCDTLNITEFDMVEMRDGAVANRHSVIETHLFHDRVLQIGPGLLGAGATLGPYSTMLPETEIGEGCSVGGRSIVMRGERLPAHTRWQGAPVVAA